MPANKDEAVLNKRIVPVGHVGPQQGNIHTLFFLVDKIMGVPLGKEPSGDLPNFAMGFASVEEAEATRKHASSYVQAEFEVRGFALMPLQSLDGFDEWYGVQFEERLADLEANRFSALLHYQLVRQLWLEGRVNAKTRVPEDVVLT